MDMSAVKMTSMAGMDGGMMQSAVWTPAYAALIFSMWWVMMVAMMLPSQIADELRIEHRDFIAIRSRYRDHLSVLK